ncbi:ppm-1.G, partial [Symbiodinium pilosum]
VIRQSLPRLDEKLRSGSWGIGWLFPGALHPFAACGSTCVTAAVDFVGREVIVGNVGDSRALLIRDGKAIALSEDHKPENPIERNRIRAAGGQVVKIGPCHRVDGNLNLSRAFGDFTYKSTASLPAEKQKVIAFPDVTRTAFRGWPQELLVLACDGLFERCSNQDIANLIWPRVKLGMPLEQIATEVLHACCARSSRGRPIEEGTDNETIILIRLPDGGQSTEVTGGSEGSEDPLAPGQRVRVQNLESEAGQKLNGLEGTVEGAGSCEGRYSVRLAGVGAKSLKAENLTPIQAC